MPDPPGRVTLDRIPVVPLADALADTLRLLPPSDAFGLVAWLVTRRVVDSELLAEAVGERRGRRGAVQLGRCFRLIEANAASVLEWEAQEFLRSAGITGWRANVPIRSQGRIVLVADILFEEARLIVEVDGFAFHNSRDSFEADRSRDALAASLGYSTLRITHRDLASNGPTVLDRIRATLAHRTSGP
jgi:very-short-patch-repair endonuclease